MQKELKKLVTVANRLSNKCEWSCYPMAPGAGLTELQRLKHRKALDACGIARDALLKAGLKEEAEKYDYIINQHSWVVNQVGCF